MTRKERQRKKRIMATGMDEFGSKYYYFCSKCRTMLPINLPRCSHCSEKRPRNAYEYAHIVRAEVQQEYGRDIDRTARNCYPTPPQPCFAVPMPTNGNYDPETYVRNAQVNLPTYYMTDEYGRVYKAKVSYGAMPVSAPVPVATPSKVIQTSPINVGINNN